MKYVSNASNVVVDAVFVVTPAAATLRIFSPQIQSVVHIYVAGLFTLTITESLDTLYLVF